MLIGREIEVLASRDKSILNLTGRVIDETKNTLLVITDAEKEVRIPKSIVTFSVSNRARDPLTIDGSKLIGTPSDRIKG